MKKSIYFTSCLGLTTICGTSVSAQPTNVVVIMPDDLSYSDFSYYNKQEDAPRTPNIDKLVSESLRLTDFHVAPTSSPSRAQLMTGRHNDACGVWHTVMGRYFLDANEVTIADVFKTNNYKTGFFGKWHLGDNYPFRPQDHGFEDVIWALGGGIDQQPSPWGSRNTMPCTVYNLDKPVKLTDENGSLADEYKKPGISGAFLTNFFTTQAIDYMKNRKAEKNPFFIYLGYNVAHLPDDMPFGARKNVSPFIATVENMDKNIGRLINYLDSAGMKENTLLVFMLSDNGMANFMLRGDKATAYEAGHRIPCIIRWPAGGYAGTEASSRDIPAMITEMDMLPTFMDVLNLKDVTNRPKDSKIVGRSIKTLLDNNSANDDAIFESRVLVVDNQRLDDLVKYKEACIMKDELDKAGRIVHKWRLMRMSANSEWELYDIQSDMLQEKDLLASGTANAEVKNTVKTLQAAYEKWWKETSVNATKYAGPIAGSPYEAVTCLFGHDWHMSAGLPPWNQTMIADGKSANGFNAVNFYQAGDYTFDLRRWPMDIEDETTICSALRTPLRVTESNALTYGVALPIHSARIRVWSGDKTYYDERKDVDASSDGPKFNLHIPAAGITMVQTWFYDKSGKELCGAYYNYITKVSER